MSDDEAFDIAGSLALKDEDDYSDSSSNEGEDFQDEIIPWMMKKSHLHHRKRNLNQTYKLSIFGTF